MARVFVPLKLELPLLTLIKEKYAESGMSDAKFADFASAELNHRINESHISNRRIALGISSSLEKRPETVISRVEKLEKELQFLKSKLGDLLK